jgi:predicted dehydrogenase
MSKPLRAAVVGVGHMGRHHARIFGELDGADLVGVVDKDHDRGKKVAEDNHTTAYENFEELFGKVDVVSIAVPTMHHLAVSRPFIERGIPVLIEKPIAKSVEEANAILALAEKHDTLVQIGHTERFNPVVKALERMEVAPKFIETHRISPFTFRSADIGVVLDMMIHDIDIVLSIVKSKPVRVDAVGINVLAPYEDVANARVAFENGCVVNLTGSRLAMKTERKIRVFSDTAYLSLDYQKKIGIAIKKTANLDILKMAQDQNVDDLSQLQGVDFGSMVNIEPLTFDDAEPLREELIAFLNSVRTGSPPVVSAREGVAAVQLAHDIVHAIATHRWDGNDSGPVGFEKRIADL